MIDKNMVEKYGWWGKFHVFFGKKPRMIWIGPMSEKEMREYFEKFRHNFQFHKPE
jgi:hypothetical protein